MSMYPDVQPLDTPSHVSQGLPPISTSRWDRTRAWWREAAQYRFFVPLLLVILALSLYLPRLAEPDKYLFDEILFAYTAGQYAEGNPDVHRYDHACSTGKNAERCGELYPDHQVGTRIGRFQWDHPPFAKLVMAGGILILGNDPVGWRISSVIVGVAGILVVYYLARYVTGRQAIGVLAAGLLMMDGMYLVYSRMGLVDIYLTVLSMSSVFALAWYLKRPFHQVRAPLLLIGLFMGLSIATKWSAAYGAFFVGLVVLGRFAWTWWTHRQQAPTSMRGPGYLQHIIWVPLALIVLPLAVYIGSYIPLFLDGYSFGYFIDLQKEMLNYHAHFSADPPTASRWWSWPLDMRSVWFGTRSLEDGRTARTYALGNPILYWAFLPAVAWTLYRWWKSQNHVALLVLAVGFFGQWLPWVFIERTTYLYHFLPSVPFGCLAVAATLVYIHDHWRDWRRTLAIEYVVLVVLAFAFFYPIVAYYPLSQWALGIRMWLPSWI